MTREELLNTIKESNERLRPYFVSYFKQMLENKDEPYWEAESLEDARFIYLGYFSGEYELYFKYLDAEIDEVYQEEELSFTSFLEDEAPGLAEFYTGFIPNVLVQEHQEELQDFALEIDELMAHEFKAVFDEIGNTDLLPVVFKEEDSGRFIDISNGATYDYVELKSYTFGKYTTKELLVLMQDKLETFQLYLSNYMEFLLQNETKSIAGAKAILITVAYDSGRIQLDFLNDRAEKPGKESALTYLEYLEKNHAYVYRRQGAHFPFEVYDYVNTNSAHETGPFKDVIDKWIMTSLTKVIDKKTPCFIQDAYKKTCLDIAKNELIGSDELRLRLK